MAHFGKINFIVILVLAGYIGLQPLSDVDSQSAPKDAQSSSSNLQLAGCYLNPDMQPRPATEMNTITSGEDIKTTYVERETYVCKTSSRQTMLADVSVYIGFMDNISNQSSAQRNIQIVTCIKDINLTSVNCKTEDPPSEFPIEEIMCSLTTQFRQPILMNTVGGDGNMTHIMKNIGADSRIFTCRDLDRTEFTKSLTTFIQVYENLEKETRDTTVETLTCLKDKVNLKVIACDIKKVM
jgi:hypothetical protein